ncbi:MAG: hypothetical protein ABIR33_14885 [Pyrinomonadaceae bacterium]
MTTIDLSSRITVLLIFLIIFFAGPVAAQSILVDGRIPDDLLITLKHYGAWGGPQTELTIDAKGEFSYSSLGGLPIGIRPDLILNGDRRKPVKYLKPRLSSDKLKLLLTEFDKIQFLRFGKDFPADNENRPFISDMGSESIVIRANGQTKEVPFDLGDSGKGARLLNGLADRIRGAWIWNYEGGKVPENFELRYQTTTGDSILFDFKIAADGKIRQSSYTKDQRRAGPIFLNTKTVGRLSAEQMARLINALEAAGFSRFRFSKLAKDDGCANDSKSNPESRTQINVQINRVQQMYASLYSECQVIPGTAADTFEQTDRAVRKALAAAGIRI